MRVLLRYGANHRLDDGAAYKLALEANHEGIKALLIQAETTMRAKERELNRILQQQGSMMAQPSCHSRAYSEIHTSSTYNTSYPVTLSPVSSTLASGTVSASSMMIPYSNGGSFAAGITAEGIPRGHKRFYSQMSSPLSVADLFRSGSVCGLVALDDEIRSRQRSESNRL